MKKLKSKKLAGFTVLEVLVGMLILSIAFVSMMMGIVYARAQFTSIMIEQRAIQELTNYIEFWKAKVFDGYLTQREMAKDPRGMEVLLYEFDDNSRPIIGRLYREAIKVEINPLYRWVKYYTIECRIEWEDFSTTPSVTKSKSMKVSVGRLDYGI